MYIKNKRTFETFIPNLSANRDDTAKPCFSKKWRNELIHFTDSIILTQYTNFQNKTKRLSIL